LQLKSSKTVLTNSSGSIGFARCAWKPAKGNRPAPLVIWIHGLGDKIFELGKINKADEEVQLHFAIAYCKIDWYKACSVNRF
jgi:hypothetical protein